MTSYLESLSCLRKYTLFSCVSPLTPNVADVEPWIQLVVRRMEGIQGGGGRGTWVEDQVVVGDAVGVAAVVCADAVDCFLLDVDGVACRLV